MNDLLELLSIDWALRGGFVNPKLLALTVLDLMRFIQVSKGNR